MRIEVHAKNAASQKRRETQKQETKNRRNFPISISISCHSCKSTVDRRERWKRESARVRSIIGRIGAGETRGTNLHALLSECDANVLWWMTNWMLKLTFFLSMQDTCNRWMWISRNFSTLDISPSPASRAKNFMLTIWKVRATKSGGSHKSQVHTRCLCVCVWECACWQDSEVIATRRTWICVRHTNPNAV